MSTVITVDAITKRFGGRAVVEDLSFVVRQGEVFALLGLFAFLNKVPEYQVIVGKLSEPKS
jgi:ABC-type uncharacterized transport system ATPase subunit